MTQSPSQPSSQPTYGLIGTGLMGLPLAQRLHNAGLTLQVYNRTPARAQPLVEAGIPLAPSATALLQAADALILMLTDAEAIAATVLTDATTPHLVGKTLIQMGTIAPSESQAIAAAVTAAGGQYLEAPVLGSIPEAQTGTLLVMVGSSAEQFEQVRPLLSHFGPMPRHIGPVGSAMALKLALNQLIAAETSAFALSLSFIQRHGVAPEAFMDLLRQSALYAPTFDKKLQRLLQRHYASPNFPTKHLLKDVKLFLQASETAGLANTSLQGIEQILQTTIGLGLGDADYSALLEAIAAEEPKL